MRSVLIFEIIGYFGIIWLLAVWYVRGELTEQRFALYSVMPLSLIMLTAGLNAYLSSSYLFGLVIEIIATIVFAIIGYQIARWIYRQVFPHK